MSTQERLYKNLVSKLICKKVPISEEREKRLLTFYNHAEFYYEIFCESIYTMMSTHSIHTISLDDFGYTRLDLNNNDNIIGFSLLSKEDITQQHDDIIVYVDLALKRLENRLQRIEEWSIKSQAQGASVKEIKIL